MTLVTTAPRIHLLYQRPFSMLLRSGIREVDDSDPLNHILRPIHNT